MKKTLKTILALMAGAIAFTACSNDDESINEKNETKLVTLTAFQENDGTQRTAIDGTTSTQIDWTSGDKINYFGMADGQSMTLSEGAGTASGTFSGAVTTGENDYVLYPYNADATCTNGTIKTTLPANQSVPAGSFDPAAAIMVGKVNGTSVQIYNCVGFLAITIPNTANNITKMIITGNNNERLAGELTIQGIAINAAPTSIAGQVRNVAADGTGTDGKKYIEVTPKNTTTFTAGSTYYVAVAPDATLSKGIYILFYDGNTSSPATLKLAVKKTSSNIAMARKKVKKTTLPAFAESDWKNMIELKDAANIGKIYMSPFNIGATESTSSTTAHCGYYFSFGEVDSKTEYSSYAYTGTMNLSGLTDAATSNWGVDWRMPTKNEFETNIEKLTDVSILPPTGRYAGTDFYASNAFYWSSTQDNSTKGYMLSIASESIKGILNLDRSSGLTVRAILVQKMAPSTGSAKKKVNGVESNQDWVQLWSGGPKFATMNIGATDVTETGSDLSWTETGANDAAATTWGNNWRVPTVEQMEEFVKATSPSSQEDRDLSKVRCVFGKWKSTDVYGYIFTGKEIGYENNTLFFPVTSNSSNGAYYWTGSTDHGGYLYRMVLGYQDNKWDSGWGKYQTEVFCPVRPVLNN